MFGLISNFNSFKNCISVKNNLLFLAIFLALEGKKSKENKQEDVANALRALVKL